MRSLAARSALWSLIVLLAIGARLGAALWWQLGLPADRRFTFPDSESYWVLGQSIAEGKPYQFGPDARIFRMPGYPLLLAGMFGIVGTDASPLWGCALGALLGGAAVAAVMFWTRALFGDRAALLAGLIAVVYPGAVAMGSFVLSEAPFCPLMIAHLALWGAAWKAESRERTVGLALVAGVAAALATLMRPGWLLFAPFALVVAMIIDKRRKQQALVGAAMLASLAICLAPWWIRNAWLTGRFVPTTLQVGASLYDGLNPRATGGSNMDFVAAIEADERAKGMEQETATDLEYRLDRRLRSEALGWAWANPGRTLALAAIKLWRLWNIWPNEPQFRAWPLRLGVALTYVPLLALALWGAWKFTPLGWPYVLAWLPAVYVTLLHTVFVSSIRYREPAMLALIALAAGLVAGKRTQKSE